MLLQPLAAVGRQDVRHVNKHIEILANARECVLKQAGLVGSRHFQDSSRAKTCFVVANLGKIRRGTSVVDGVAQRVCNSPNNGHLRNYAVFRCAAGAALMEHREAREVAIGEIARVSIGARVQIRTELDHAQWSRNTRESVSAINSPRLHTVRLVQLDMSCVFDHSLTLVNT